LFELERFAARRFGATLLVSRHEADSFAAMAPESAARIFALTNGVNREYFAPGAFANPFAGDEDPIVMTGSMDYRPNVDGAKWFFHEVLPLLTKDLPRARFYVVGSKPPASLCALCGPKLVVTGRVDDVRPYLQHAAAVVAPLRIARGLQNKVLEAMAMAKPVITTQDSSRGLSASSGVQLFIQDDAWAFAAAVVTAVQGKDRSEVARRAREYVELHHDWTRNLSVLDDLLAGRGLPAAEATSEHRSMRRLGQAPGPSVEPSIAEVPR
jgi:sugar transferase (PEP-CTERM/EpsH1 system associated)